MVLSHPHFLPRNLHGSFSITKSPQPEAGTEASSPVCPSPPPQAACCWWRLWWPHHSPWNAPGVAERRLRKSPLVLWSRQQILVGSSLFCDSYNNVQSRDVLKYQTGINPFWDRFTRKYNISKLRNNSIHLDAILVTIRLVVILLFFEFLSGRPLKMWD